MKIEVYCSVNNEEKMIPFFMRYYTLFADVIILENNSTDKTVEIAQSMGARIWSYKRVDELDECWLLTLKNNCWKTSQADWVIICDADEFVYHPNLVEILENTDMTIFRPRFFNMFSDKFPTTKGHIQEEVTMGKEENILAKMNLFRPSEIKEINYGVGCHSANPTGNVKLDENSEIFTLHMKFLSRQYVIDRYEIGSKKMSAINKQFGWGFYPDWTPEVINKYFDNEMPNLRKII